MLAADEQAAASRVVAPSARVVTVPAGGDDPAESPGALVLVEVSPAAALALAQATAGGALSVTWR